MQTVLYPLSVLYRFILAFGIGYAGSYLLSVALIDVFYPYLAKAESIYLAAFIALFFLHCFCDYQFLCTFSKKAVDNQPHTHDCPLSLFKIHRLAHA